MRVMDIYHHLSRAMYYDLDTGKLIKDEDALKLREKIKQAGASPIEWVKSSGITADVWGDGHPTQIYGNIFEL